jgi:serine O-acetyltransferase
MILSTLEYHQYLEADRIALKRSAKKPKLFGDEVWKFQRSLRALEYSINCRRGPLGKLIQLFHRYRFHHLSLRCGFSIPPNVFGPGLAITHRGTIVVHSRAIIGAGCRINACVNIGASGGEKDAVPVLGNNIYIGPGAKIFGKIRLADGIAIGANAVVNRSFDEPGITIAGVPARQINVEGSARMIKSRSVIAA